MRSFLHINYASKTSYAKFLHPLLHYIPTLHFHITTQVSKEFQLEVYWEIKFPTFANDTVHCSCGSASTHSCCPLLNLPLLLNNTPYCIYTFIPEIKLVSFCLSSSPSKYNYFSLTTVNFQFPLMTIVIQSF